MGSTDDPNNKGIDASVGGLVWVRRRNGSWWPGRILSVDELSESCLVSPRSGTPVKLLGRDDASVDWYNLEKSKRVKAFRCGEYDDCIERAKAAANSNKKAVKYARREDAILHALEIESIRLGKDPPNFFRKGRDGSISELGSPPRDSPTSSHSIEENEDMTDGLSGSESDLGPGFLQSKVLFEESNHITASKMQSKQGRRRRTPNDSEDEGTEGIKRMRGLEDLGMCVASKGKAQGGGVLDLAQEHSAALCDSNNVNCMANGSPVNGNKVYTSLKRKRSQVANETLKRKNRRRALTQVLESVVPVPVSVTDQLASSNCLPQQGLIDGKVSGIDSNDSRKNIYVVDNNISDSAGVLCENNVFLNGSEHLYDASNVNSKANDSEIPTKSGLAENNSSNNLFEVPFVGEGKQSAGLSSTLVTCSYGKPHGFLGRLSTQTENLSMKVGRLNESGSTCSEAVLFSNCSPKVESGTSKWKLKGKRNSRQKNKNRKQSNRKYANMDNNELNDDSVGLETMNEFPQSSKEGDCDDIDEPLMSYSRSNQAKLVTVDNADGLKEWEKFTPPPDKGGHIRGPLTTQRSLPYRQSRFTVNPKYGLSDFPGRTSALYDVKLQVKASYRPQHVPLVSLMSKSQAIVGHPVTVEALGNGEVDKAHFNTTDMSSFPVDVIDSVKPISDGVRNPKKRVRVRSRLSSRKSSKTKKSASLSKKIRKLSSLSVQKPNEVKKVMMEQRKEPVVACIPLKVVISRISEAVNGSTRPPHPHRATPSKNS